jgi:hypothetical protein
MPSFDAVSEVDLHDLTNAVDQASRVVNTRFDFKGSNASFVRNERAVELKAESEMHIEQMVDLLRGTLVKCKIDPMAMEEGKLEQSGMTYKTTITIKHGIETELAKKMVKLIKDSKIKVQSQIQGEQLRVTGKKRDDLQQAMALLRAEDSLGVPLQFTNFRD